jgi:WD40 repeat protein
MHGRFSRRITEELESLSRRLQSAKNVVDRTKVDRPGSGLLGVAVEKGVPLAPLVMDGGGKWLACGTPSGRIHLIKPATLKPERVLEGHVGAVTALAFHPKCPLLVSGSPDGKVRIWSLPSPRSKQELEGHSGSILATVFSSDGRLLATADSKGEIRIWDTRKPESSKFDRSLRTDRDGPVNAIAVSSDGHRLYSGGPGVDILVWDLTRAARR